MASRHEQLSEPAELHDPHLDRVSRTEMPEKLLPIRSLQHAASMRWS